MFLPTGPIEMFSSDRGIYGVVRLFICFFAVVCGCSDLEVAQPSGPDLVTLSFVPQSQLDLLLMVDNTYGTEEEQSDLARVLPGLFVALREGLPGGAPDLRAGVITSDLGAAGFRDGVCGRPLGSRGVLVWRLGCGLDSGGARFLTAPGGRSVLEDLQVSGHLACLGKVGVMGCPFEQPLGAIAAAVDPDLPANPGFLRAGAHLGIVFLTDEDDCSGPPDTDFFTAEIPGQNLSTRCSLAGHLCKGAHPPAAPFRAPIGDCEAAEDGSLTPVKALVERVRASKVDPDRQITVAGIFGAPLAHPSATYRLSSGIQGLEQDPLCQSSGGEAYPGLRLASFVAAFGSAGTAEDLCQNDLTDGFTHAGQVIAAHMTSACLPAPVAECQVNAGDLVLPACSDPGLVPCWRLEPDASCLDSRQQLRLEGAPRLPAGTRIEARCTRD
jgi:hypothetical protein